MAVAAPPPPHLRQLVKFDTDLSYYLHSLFHSYLPSSVHLVLELSADFRFSFRISLAICLSPLPSSFLPFFSSLLFGLLLDLALVGLVKLIFRRRRPPYNPHMSAVVSADNFSFPSGHASRVFFVAALVSLAADAIEAALVELRDSGGFVDRWIVGDGRRFVSSLVLVVRVWATVTAFSRVLLGRHFFFDISYSCFSNFKIGVHLFNLHTIGFEFNQIHLWFDEIGAFPQVHLASVLVGDNGRALVLALEFRPERKSGGAWCCFWWNETGFWGVGG